ncbi:PREDICTED: D site-binding protein-like [Priapulus caudatus]|uniref:D site-binding protein-like n=1 Tax=Priapulus caudatus TaxID=37621 RepID=A0ABM1DYT9_PRICU|nr:PREDICTED: D site-binding protein-like [Priapulus caudatus]
MGDASFFDYITNSAANLLHHNQLFSPGSVANSYDPTGGSHNAQQLWSHAHLQPEPAAPPAGSAHAHDVVLKNVKTGLPLTPPGSPDEAKDLSTAHRHQMSQPPAMLSTNNDFSLSAFSSGHGMAAAAAAAAWHGFPGYGAHSLPLADAHATEGATVDQVNFGASTSAGALSSQAVLAKPVPVRRLSEKRIAQARACIGSVPGIMPDHNDLGPVMARAIAATTSAQRRPRTEKRPVPSESKDVRYYERRSRNNSAAKKSRDMRKEREDEIAVRACFLEKENAVLRAQVSTLRDEAGSLRQLLMQKRGRHAM